LVKDLPKKLTGSISATSYSAIGWNNNLYISHTKALKTLEIKLRQLVVKYIGASSY
jgi:hypothetical protein